MNNIEWLWANGTEFDTHAAGIPEKLSKHGYAVALNRMEAGKMQTAELCIHDVLASRENPNIAIICPKHLAPSWHFSLLWDMGLEFKYFGVFEKSLDVFSDVVANFCIVSEEALLSGSDFVLSQAGGSGIVWDLMIVNIEAENADIISEQLKNTKAKTKKLLINADSGGDINDTKYEKLSALVKNVLQRNKKDKSAECPISLEADGQAAAGRNMAGNYDVRTINYKIDGALTAKTERIDDVRLGVPLYSYGGNIFEEYHLKERKIYLSDEYDKMQLKALLAADGKLEAFLKEIVTLLADSENRIVVYCTSQNTVNYVSKALWACNGGKKGICVYDRATTDGEFVKSELSGADGANTEEPNIIVADDKAGSRFLNVEKITHIINYEYPESPAVLEQRLTRMGRKANPDNPAFYIFCDEDYKFDGRMLRKTVLSNIGRAFSRVPDKNLLFDIDGIEEHLIVLILDLKFIADNAKDDIVESFRVEYNAPEADTAADAADTAQKRLKSLVEMFGLQEIMKQEEVDGEKLFMQISEQIGKFKGKRVCLDKKGVLSLAGASAAPAEVSFAELKKAAESAAKLTGKKEDFGLIKTEIEKLSYYQKLSVLAGVWKHYRFVLGIPKSYKDFIELYNYVKTH